jgi:hypothetical protein
MEKVFRVCCEQEKEEMELNDDDVNLLGKNEKVKVKLSLYLTKHHATKTYRGVEV